MPRYKRKSLSFDAIRIESLERAKVQALSYLFAILANDITRETMKLPLTIKLTYERDLGDACYVAEIEAAE